MGRQGRAILLTQPLDGGGQADGAGNVRGAGFEFVRQLVLGACFEADRFNHFAAGLVGRHGFQQCAAAIEHADTGGAK